MILVETKKIKNLNSTNSYNILVLAVVFALLSSRLFYCLIYNWSYYTQNIMEIVRIDRGGLSFFGGLLGGLSVSGIMCKIYDINWLKLMDYVVIPLSFFMILGRITNFLNKEIVGYPTNTWIGYDFGDDIKRHPSQLYSAFKNLIIFTILISIKKRISHINGAVFGMFLVLYGVFRYCVYMFREPTETFLFLAFGQWFSLCVFIMGLVILYKTGYLYSVFISRRIL